MQPYRHIFFDLDHTLWDFETNSKVTLLTIFKQQFPDATEEAVQHFYLCYFKHNKHLWDLYHQHLIEKEELRTRRFRDTFDELGISEDPEFWSAEYLQEMPHQNRLFPGVERTLEYLSAKYTLSLITNGFKEVQRRKVMLSGLSPYFQDIFISEEIGFQKPHPQIFTHALDKSGIKAFEAVMVGDHFDADVKGAQQSGIKAFWFNPDALPTPNPNVPHTAIRQIEDLLQWL